MSAKRGDPRLSRAYKSKRLQILHRDNYTCYYCGGEANQVDHVIPISKQGDPMDSDNMVSACKRCNVSKGNRSQGLFLAKSATPPVFRDCISLSMAVVTQPGPCMGQPEQDS
jgi:5-methylcytosine-specific restriction endonuclease McrA